MVLNQPLEYLAPEYGLSSKCDLSSDMFSYGMLFYAAYNNGKTLYKCNDNYSSFVNNVEEVKLHFFVTTPLLKYFILFYF